MEIKESIKKMLESKSGTDKHKWIWIIFSIVTVIVSILIGVICWALIIAIFKIATIIIVKFDKEFTGLPEVQIYWIFLIAFFSLAIIYINALMKSWSQVLQKHVWLVEVFGEYCITWTAGLHFIFPYFQFVSYVNVYIGERQKKLFMDEQYKSDVGGGDVEFEDASAPVEATIYYQIVNPKKAVYEIENLEAAIEEKMDSAVRSFMGSYTIDDANKIKARTNLINIMNNDYINPKDVKKENKDDIKIIDKEKIKEEMEEVALWKYMYENWGVMITGLAISDIVLSDEQKKARRQKLIEKSNAEASVFVKTKLENIGKGLASQVDNIVISGVDPNVATDYLAKIKQWENVGEKGATVIVESGAGSVAGLGAQFAAGKKTVNEKQKKQTKKNKNN